MADLFKNVFNPSSVAQLAECLSVHCDSFVKHAFIHTATKNLEQLELKARSQQIQSALTQYLPNDFEHSARILNALLMPLDTHGEPLDDTSIKGVKDWMIMPLADFVAEHGKTNIELALNLLQAMTIRFSSEFAIRHFLISHPQLTLDTLAEWSTHPNRHVRRLVSEGSRPRLPWGIQLKQFIKDPAPLIPLLSALKDDSEEYVRRSVANNLNDIAKDHPDKVATLAIDWLSESDVSTQRKKLLRHGCRTLLKNAHPQALCAFGYQQPELARCELLLGTPIVKMGSALEFSLEFESRADAPQKLMIDYVLHLKKANGALSPKVFKWKDFESSPQQHHDMRKLHSFKPVTVRRYYPGDHQLDIVINGQQVATTGFTLIV